MHQKLRYKVCSLLAGRNIETTLTIMDFNGKSLNIANSNIYSFIKQMAPLA